MHLDDWADGIDPPIANAAVFVPVPDILRLPIIKAPPADQDVPLYDSVQRKYDGDPPNAKAAVCVPAFPKPYLAVDKAPPADHDPP